MKSRIRLFANVVCASPEVRTAFRARGIMELWWKGLLALHQKPNLLKINRSEERSIIAAGFRFYASLYQYLGLIFLTLSMVNLSVAFVAGYWTLLGILTSVYLWLAGSIARSGARDFEVGTLSGTISLVCFLFMIAMFLAAFVIAASIAFHCQQSLPTFLNLFLTTLLFVFGIGSYALELVYLFARRIELK
ncbi:hypothetical protein [Pedosphaera parvula]|uniref:Transmembrane protein n=1 Tax=Pedosphaera parvula (strain Ellin514) TaxID=320771 RepID=B9XNA7_PEDPL|nr:hypothetical protein [Pedosphaera parvula]EEF58660.1 hypothetical protein Cflav_PD1561 [Pedosphaera parvula Ellin514]